MVLHALHLHLCSGYGGFEIALRYAGIDTRTVGHVERDAHAAATLVARMEEQALDQVPIWDDLCTFDSGPWRGRVDIITAGFPCQPFSLAGQRKGLDDNRWLWPDIARIVRDVGPRFVLLENVTGLVRDGLAHVLSDLASFGFDAEWGCLSAEAVGAPHQRNRFWLLAYSGCDGLETSSGTRRHEQEQPQPSSARHHVWPPEPHDSHSWDRYIASGGHQPSIRRGADGAPTGVEQSEQLHLLGNGLVPQCAAEAIRQLARRTTNRIGPR